jgi:hypothetical protein
MVGWFNRIPMISRCTRGLAEQLRAAFSAAIRSSISCSELSETRCMTAPIWLATLWPSAGFGAFAGGQNRGGSAAREFSAAFLVPATRRVRRVRAA